MHFDILYSKNKEQSFSKNIFAVAFVQKKARNILTIENGSEFNKIEINLPDRNYLYFMGATPISESKYVLVGARGLAVTLDTTTTEIMGLIKW